MAPISMTLNHLKGHIKWLKSFYLTHRRKYSTHICLHMNRKVNVGCGDAEGLLKVTANHVHCRSGKMSWKWCTIVPYVVSTDHY